MPSQSKYCKETIRKRDHYEYANDEEFCERKNSRERSRYAVP